MNYRCQQFHEKNWRFLRILWKSRKNEIKYLPFDLILLEFVKIQETSLGGPYESQLCVYFEIGDSPEKTSSDICQFNMEFLASLIWLFHQSGKILENFKVRK